MAQMKKQPMPKKKTRVSDPKPKAPAKTKMYTGGTPFFNEMTGKTRKASAGSMMDQLKKANKNAAVAASMKKKLAKKK